MEVDLEITDNDKYIGNFINVDISDKSKESVKISTMILNELFNDYGVNSVKDINKDNSYFSYGSLHEPYLTSVFKQKIEENYVDSIKNYRQMKGSLCGFHALFNISNFCQYLIAENKYAKRFYLQTMNSGMQFYKFHQNVVKFLLNSGDVPEYMVEDLVNYGPLEREYIDPVISVSNLSNLT